MRHELRHVKPRVSQGRPCEAQTDRRRGKTPWMIGQASETTPRRLKILGADEIEALYGRPAVTPDERVQYVTVSQPESEGLQAFRSVPSKRRPLFCYRWARSKPNTCFSPSTSSR